MVPVPGIFSEELRKREEHGCIGEGPKKKSPNVACQCPTAVHLGMASRHAHYIHSLTRETRAQKGQKGNQ